MAAPTPAPYVPQRGPPPARVKPAGWVVIVLVLGAAGYFAWPRLAALLAQSERAAPPAGGAAAPTRPGGPALPRRPDAPAPASGEGLVLARELFPAAAAALPEVRQGSPAAKVALPALVGVELPTSGARPASSEVEAIRLVARGEVDAAIVSVAGFAAVPDAPAQGVKAAWYVGESPQDGALFPSCDGAALRRTHLGAVPGSLAHFHLLAALAGDALPPVALFDRDAELDRAINDKVVTGGAARARALKSLAAAGRPPCSALPASAFALVAVRRVSSPMTAAELAAIAALVRRPLPAPEEVAAFFDPGRRAPGSFAELYEAAGDVWSAVGLIDRPASSKAAVDRTFLDGGGGALVAVVRPQARRGVAKELGFPCWLDPEASPPGPATGGR